KANLVMNYAKTIRKTRTLNQTSVNKTSNNRFNAELTYDADKIGIIRLAHEMMMLDPVDRLIMADIDQNFLTQPVYSKNIRLTLDRNHLPIKGFTFSPNVGYRYGGDNKGLNFGASLGYIFRNGRQLMINYAYNSSFGKYMTGALSFGGSKSHSLSFNFVDTIGFGKYNTNKTNNSFNSSFDPNNGVIKGTVFLDLNQNGIKDEGEEGVPEVDINFQNLFTVTTDNKGNFIAANIPKGLRKVGIEKETLPVIYTPTVADALVNVKAQKVYVANLGVVVTPGSISGKVNVNKDNANNSDVVILLLDKTGKEVKYTTTDSVGNFYLESVAPGDYTIVVDKNYLDYKGLKAENSEGNKVNIPMVTDDFVDIDGIEINLVAKQGEVQKF
ncbi:MAG: SdrD B-like domain-containing protein, partial [Vampirovibrionia bacterium]